MTAPSRSPHEAAWDYLRDLAPHLWGPLLLVVGVAVWCAVLLGLAIAWWPSAVAWAVVTIVWSVAEMNRRGEKR